MKPKPTAKMIARVPGTIKLWLKTYLPMRVEPVSSICTAPSKVGYVGNTKRAETAAKLATRM